MGVRWVGETVSRGHSVRRPEGQLWSALAGTEVPEPHKPAALHLSWPLSEAQTAELPLAEGISILN